MNKTLLLILLLAYSLTSAAQSNTVAQHSLQSVFSLWLTDKSTLVPNFTADKERLIAQQQVVSGGEIRHKNEGKACIAYAPHRYYDKHTYAIAQALYQQHCQIMLANTLHRNHQDAIGRKVDLGKYPFSATTSFIKAYAELQPQISIYQIHGFSRKKRRTAAGKTAEVILSQGLTEPTPELKKIKQCLMNELNLKALLFPLEVNELGGTKNILNYVKPNNAQFFHIEMSLSVREALISKPEFMSTFNQCLIIAN